MKKSTLINFITKYSLGGDCEAVLLQIKNKSLQCKFVTESKNVLGEVSFTNVDLQDGDIGIYQTGSLLKILAILDEDIDVTYFQDKGKLLKIIFKDKNIKAEVALGDPTLLPSIPSIKYNPKEDIAFNISGDMISNFNKAKNALADATTFAITADNTSIIKLTLNYSMNINTNRIELFAPAVKDCMIEPIYFPSDIFREILNANKNSTSGSMKVSSEGLATISFTGEDFRSQYYMLKIKV